MTEREPIKEWFTAAEIAALKLATTPGTERGVNMVAKQENWRQSSLSRKRAGRGGGWEYHKSLLPQAARFEIARRFEERAADRAGRAVAEASKVEIAAIAPETQKLTARQRDVMLARALILMRVDQRVMERGRTRSQAIARVIDDLSGADADPDLVAACPVACERKDVPSRTQLFAWLKARDEVGIAGLAPKPKGAKSNLPTWFDGFLKFYALPMKPTVASALEDYCASLKDASKAPSYDQVRRALSKLGPLERAAGREGKLAMRARLAYVRRDTTDLMPTSVYVADGKTFDAEISHPVHGGPMRPEITSIIDAATRVCVGVSADLSERTFAVAEALRHACRDYGIPALWYTDRGPGYISSGMTDPVTGFLARAGITHLKALPYGSQAKGIIERLNQIYTPMAKRYPTYMGTDMDKEAKHKAYKITRKEMAEFNFSQTRPTWAQFLTDLQETIREYNNKPHSALPKIADGGRKRHMTPLEMWAAKRADGFEPIVPAQSELDDMFRPYQVRVAQRGLVTLETNRYFLIDLERYDGQRVAVGYDNFDASKVWIRELERTDEGERPGAAIGIGIFEGNTTRFVPRSMEQQALETRVKGQIKRIDKKRDAALEGLEPSLQIEHQRAMPTIETPGEDRLIVQTAANDAGRAMPAQAARPGFNGRPRFSGEMDYIRWLLDNPGEFKARDRDNVREYLGLSTFHDNAVSHGIDVDALKALVRSVA